MATREELAHARKDFLHSHEAVLEAEDEEFFEPGEVSAKAARAAREWRSTTYTVYLKLRHAAKTANHGV